MFALIFYVGVTHLAPIIQCIDIMCVLMCEFLPIAASETQRVFVIVCSGVQPGSRVEAVISESLLGCGTEQLQEVQLDDVD